jgi:hypothetical protein
MTPQTTKECQKDPFCRNIPIISLLCVIYSIKKIIKLKQFKNQRNIKNIKKKELNKLKQKRGVAPATRIASLGVAESPPMAIGGCSATRKSKMVVAETSPISHSHVP